LFCLSNTCNTMFYYILLQLQMSSRMLVIDELEGLPVCEVSEGEVVLTASDDVCMPQLRSDMQGPEQGQLYPCQPEAPVHQKVG
jgi:hypothetical protein